jgi:predicted metalloendopeptidase
LKEVKTYLSKNPPIFVVKRSLLADLNSYYAETDKELLANYLCVLYIDSQMPYLNASLADFVDPDVIKQFESFETSDQTETNNSTVLQNHFGFVTDHLFVKKCVDPTAIENVQKIADEVKVRF